jgi:hypothetical protein
VAVFLPYELSVPDADTPVEIIIRAVPHVTVEFEWVDRREEKDPADANRDIIVSGHVPRAGTTPAWWRGATQKIGRDGREFLVVKVPRALTSATLTLPAAIGGKVSYEDDRSKSGPGEVDLGDVTIPRRRIIYADEPDPARDGP